MRGQQGRGGTEDTGVVSAGGGGERGRRREVASYGSYGEARGAVGLLSDRGFPVERVSIVAEGLGFEERVMGRGGYGPAALEGFGAGALPAALICSVFGLFGLVNPLVSGPTLAFWGLLFGAPFGAAFGLGSRALSGGRSAFNPIGVMRADRYAVVANEEVADGASRRLSGGDRR